MPAGKDEQRRQTTMVPQGHEIRIHSEDYGKFLAFSPQMTGCALLALQGDKGVAFIHVDNLVDPRQAIEQTEQQFLGAGGVKEATIIRNGKTLVPVFERIKAALLNKGRQGQSIKIMANTEADNDKINFLVGVMEGGSISPLSSDKAMKEKCCISRAPGEGETTYVAASVDARLDVPCEQFLSFETSVDYHETGRSRVQLSADIMAKGNKDDDLVVPIFSFDSQKGFVKLNKALELTPLGVRVIAIVQDNSDMPSVPSWAAGAGAAALARGKPSVDGAVKQTGARR
jgi:hypothetical protein